MSGLVRLGIGPGHDIRVGQVLRVGDDDYEVLALRDDGIEVREVPPPAVVPWVQPRNRHERRKQAALARRRRTAR